MFFSNIRYLLIIICIFLIFNKLCNAQDVDELYYNIIASFPTPGSSPQGLAWDSTYIWLSDDSTDTIYKISPVDGSVIFSFCAPGPEPRGMTYDGTNLWNLDDSLRKIYKLNQNSGIVIDSLYFPIEVGGISTLNCSFTGLTWDGEYLYTNFEAGWSSQIIRINVNNDSVSYFSFTRGNSNDLAFDGMYIWNCVDNGGVSRGHGDKYDLDGLRLNHFDTPGYYPTGITYNNGCFWIADKGTDSLYQIQLIPTTLDDFEINSLNLPHILSHNYPNPFNSQTVITYELNKTIFVQLKVYDLIGKEVVTLINGKQTAGSYHVSWNGKNKNGKEVSSGIYLYQLRTENFSQSKKMILIR